MSTSLYQSKLDRIGDAIAERLRTAPVLSAEACEVISKVDDDISSIIEERVAKLGGLLCIVALMRVGRTERHAAGPRVSVTWNISLWAKRMKRVGRNPAVVMFEDILSRLQGWQPDADGLCYDEFDLVSGTQQPHPKYVLYEVTFTSSVTLAVPSLISAE